jgi:hypothetical protein
MAASKKVQRPRENWEGGCKRFVDDIDGLIGTHKGTGEVNT